MKQLAACTIAGLALAGCSTTQEKSRELASHASRAAVQHGLKVTRRNRDVEVLDTAVVHDRYGTAAVVELRSTARRPQSALPLAISVRDDAGRREFANDQPGLDPALTHVSMLKPGERVFWVHDQVRAEHPHEVVAKIGRPAGPAPEDPPRLTVSGLKRDSDPDGVVTRGVVTNDSRIEQLKVILYAVALAHGKVVAAGRAGIERIKPGARARFKVFWIGNPAGADVRVFAPPSVLEED